MKLIFATNNKHKLAEASTILGPGAELSTPADYGITEDIPETQLTLEGNALQKARYVFEWVRSAGSGMVGSGGACLESTYCGNTRPGVADTAARIAIFADDTGLEVAALGGAPGVRSARYAQDAGKGSGLTGEGTYDDNNRLLLHNLEGAEDRNACFRTVIALILGRRDGTCEEYLFEGRVNGHIIGEYRGKGGFGYDPVFVPEVSGKISESSGSDGGKTFAEMGAEEKNAVSHRARAIEKLNKFLKTKTI